MATKQMLDVVAMGSLCTKQLNVIYTLIDGMSSNGYQWSFEKNKPVKTADIFEVDALTRLAAQVEAISKRLDTIQVKL